MRYAICEMESFFDKEFDGTLCKVKRVLQVCNDIQEACELEEIFRPSRYGDYNTDLRVVPENELESTFR